MTNEQMTWDLSQLVEDTNPASIQNNLLSIVAEAEKIRETYYGKIQTLDAKGLLQLLETKDAFTLKFEGVTKYCNLLYSANSINDVAKQLNGASRRATMKANQALAFITIDLGKLLAANPSLINDSTLAEYKHYLEKIMRRVPHMLSESDERLVILKDRNGISAWSQFQGDWLSTRTFDIEIEGKRKTLPYGEIIGFYQSPDRSLRRQSHQIVHEGLGKDEIIWASALRSVCEDHLQMCELRQYSNPMTQSFISNDVDQEIIDSLLKTVEKNVGLHLQYLALKAKLMDLPKLANYDLMAPLPNAPRMEYSWKESREEVTTAYNGFDDEIGGWINDMYEKRHIDGEVRKGKRSGAFCASWLTGKSAYILQSFNARMGDVYTQAHELGHAVHDYLGSRMQKPSNFEIGSCMAETASVFGELLLTERLLSKTKTKEEKQAILASVLDHFCMVVFQVSARAFLEQSLYETVKEGKFLDGEAVASLWVAARSKMYGDSVEWLDEMRWQWATPPHYYMANYRFYNYPYVYAQLFVFALYRLYKEQGKSFVPKLKKLLASGSSKSPRELAAEIGLDISDPAFWEKGMKQAEEFISMLEQNM